LNMPKQTRRDFIKTSSMAAGGVAAYAAGLPIGTPVYGSPAETAAQRTADEIERRFYGTLTTVAQQRWLGDDVETMIRIYGIQDSDNGRWADFVRGFPSRDSDFTFLRLKRDDDSKFYRDGVTDAAAKEAERRFPENRTTVKVSPSGEKYIEVYNMKNTQEHPFSKDFSQRLFGLPVLLHLLA